MRLADRNLLLWCVLFVAAAVANGPSGSCAQPWSSGPGADSDGQAVQADHLTRTALATQVAHVGLHSTSNTGVHLQHTLRKYLIGQSTLLLLTYCLLFTASLQHCSLCSELQKL
jgi:hypothetical protein